MASEYDNNEIELEDDEELEQEFENDEQNDAISDEASQDEKNAYAEIMGDMAYAVASSIPPLSLAVAVSEVAKAAWDLLNSTSRAESSQAKFQLLMGIICVVPGIGGGFRLAFKSLIRKPQFYGPVMFDVVVAILEEANRLFKMDLPLNPEKYLTQMIDVPVLQGYLDDIRVKSVAELSQYTAARWLGLPEKLDEFLRGVSGQLTTIIEDILAPAVRIAIERCIMRRKNSATNSNVTAKNKNAGASTTNKGSTPTVTKSRGNLTARIKSQFNNINMNFVIGGVGEHIADYYCLEELGWGKGQWEGHDKAKQGTWKQSPSSLHLGKLNDAKKLNHNSAIGNDTGIDGLWRADPLTNQGKKYAVIEAKATAGVARPTTKYVASRLGVLKETDKGKPIVQMSYKWINDRIKIESSKLRGDSLTDINNAIIRKNLQSLYCRHIIVVSLLFEPGLSHIEALLDDTKTDLDHVVHHGVVIHKYGEPTIENIIQEKHRRIKNKDSSNKPK
ncbi:hypothetical protein [Gilliamella sp. wkB171]|uniref:hypothetical protein n=1 Tax=Gilliamella sp. wkB171 TaxID=3120258 RepID=UPI0008134F18|nr:hypothetical protein [Gilliamella apicola]OCL19162.1 hypothetical protein A9G03_09360 [Gilliamella apicola]